MSKDLLSKLLAGMAAALVAGVSHADAIVTRADLVGLLGGQGTVEGFDKFVVPAGVASKLDCLTLDNQATCNGQGPSLVVPGVAFTWGKDPQGNTAMGQWNGKGYSGAPSQDVLSQRGPLEIDFLNPVQAFGVDLRAFDCIQCFAIAVVQIWDADDKGVIGTLSGKELKPGELPLFVGWQDAGGIGKIVLIQAGQEFSPIIDNLEFGNFRVAAVPEPSVLALIALGLAALLARRLTKPARA